MTNKIMKLNKTKFDYVSRKLGLISIIIFIICGILTMTVLASSIQKQKNLNNIILNQENKE